MAELKIEFNDAGNFRLVVDGERSEWEAYQHPLEFKGYIALTQYYGDRERILKFEEVDMKTIPVISVCEVCGQPTGWDGTRIPLTACEHHKAKWPTLVEGYKEPKT